MISGDDVVARLLTMMPGQETVTLKSRSGESFASATWKARRKPAMREELTIAQAVLGQTWIVFQLYATGQTTTPQFGDRLVDAGGATYEVKNVAVKMQQRIFNCLCLKDITT